MADGHEPSNDGLSWIPMYKVPLFLAGISIILIGISISIFIKAYQPAIPIAFDSDTISASASAILTQSIMVDIEGAVIRPGVYRLSQGSRVEDVLTLAGGFSREADVVLAAKTINRAALLVDGGKLYIPYAGVVSGPQVDGTQARGGSDASNQDTINVNTASQSELEMLSGIGPVTARKIIDNRPYLTLDELLERKVIGSGVFEKVKQFLSP